MSCIYEMDCVHSNAICSINVRKVVIHKDTESAFYQLKRPQQKAESHKAFGYWREKERGMVICQYADKFAK